MSKSGKDIEGYIKEKIAIFKKQKERLKDTYEYYLRIYAAYLSMNDYRKYVVYKNLREIAKVFNYTIDKFEEDIQKAVEDRNRWEHPEKIKKEEPKIVLNKEDLQKLNELVSYKPSKEELEELAHYEKMIKFCGIRK